jgi:glc operon protein GlcG
MRTRFLIAPGMVFLLALANMAGAQQPSSPATPKPDYGPPISNEQAKTVAAAAVAEARKSNLRMAISIVGPAGELVYFEKMDGAQLASTELAHGKARTAVLFRLPSKAFYDQYSAGITNFMTFPEKPVASEGGVPIVVNGKIIGAIGASGAAGYQDSAVAAAGANAAR